MGRSLGSRGAFTRGESVMVEVRVFEFLWGWC